MLMAYITYHFIIFNIKDNSSIAAKKQTATTIKGKNTDTDNSTKIVIKFFIYPYLK